MQTSARRMGFHVRTALKVASASIKHNCRHKLQPMVYRELNSHFCLCAMDSQGVIEANLSV